MANLTDVIDSFATGDLVFTHYPAKPPQPIHVTLYLAAKDAPSTVGGNGFAHAGKTEVEIASVKDYAEYADGGGYLHCKNTDMDRQARAAAIAKIFATTTKATPYGAYPTSKDVPPNTKSPNASRFTGMIKTESIVNLPFDFTALNRLLKWTLRAEKGSTLSANRGITCAAFVSLCHQVGEMRNYLHNNGALKKLEDCVHKTNAMLETKATLRARKGLTVLIPAHKSKTNKPIYRDQALRANSNRQLDPKKTDDMNSYEAEIKPEELYEFNEDIQKGKTPLSDIDKHWLYIQHAFLGISHYGASSLQEIIPPEFFFDAKYMNSLILVNFLPKAKGWKATEYKKYK